MTELDLLVKAMAEDLGDPYDWSAPVEFRESLALCALNSAYPLRCQFQKSPARNVRSRLHHFWFLGSAWDLALPGTRPVLEIRQANAFVVEAG
ncbi:UNVERIFIED_ORG: hypothetical protein ABIB19_001569 [Arthrobacter sp. UYEF10]